MKSVKVAAIQPKTYRENQEKKNLDNAVKYIQKASNMGAQIISLPELYPGPNRDPMSFSATEPLARTAKDVGSYVLFGAAIAEKGKIYNTYNMLSPEGELIYRYRKTTMDLAAEAVLATGNFSEGDKLEVIETDLGKIGLLICVEAWFPELSRILALRGADILFFPTGHLLYNYKETWKTILWARAIENIAYVVCTQNLLDDPEDGFSYIISPEKILMENLKEGILLADLDLDHLSHLKKETIKFGLPKETYRTVPALLSYVKPRQLYKSYTKNI